MDTATASDAKRFHVTCRISRMAKERFKSPDRYSQCGRAERHCLPGAVEISVVVSVVPGSVIDSVVY